MHYYVYLNYKNLSPHGVNAAVCALSRFRDSDEHNSRNEENKYKRVRDTGEKSFPERVPMKLKKGNAEHPKSSEHRRGKERQDLGFIVVNFDVQSVLVASASSSNLKHDRRSPEALLVPAPPAQASVETARHV